MAETNIHPKYKEGDRYTIPSEGSLGLLAVGYRGVQMWREVRDARLENIVTTKKEDKKSSKLEKDK